ncbi:Succinate dehydrogenase cytochrome b subunit [Methylophaga thiooxydans]|uniref:Succinate dehydrogenase cytochrome b subunit n=1 Tax=Methylophaga thiooxydans TaxID=392484 RepID=A0A0A0BDR0_9GAMM|nr:succinate dehydrogenase [Methylophaga thiooxydans]KGM06091.1 Succinate dehydrogenase cytochrome b subunit [Methylophaga thiooxydans]
MKLLQLQKRSMALAGSVMTVYLVFHMLSNLSFFSDNGFNQFYAFYNQAWVRWPVLALVIISLFIHVKAAIAIRLKNSQARGQGYHKHNKIHVPAPLVTISIALLFTFIVVHITQSVLSDATDVYAVVTGWFTSTFWFLFYLAGLFIMAMHLLHSLVNVMQTLGISSKMHAAMIYSSVVMLSLGFAAVPVYIWMTQ